MSTESGRSRYSEDNTRLQKIEEELREAKRRLRKLEDGRRGKSCTCGNDCMIPDPTLSPYCVSL